jgi:hypothetical protein
VTVSDALPQLGGAVVRTATDSRRPFLPALVVTAGAVTGIASSQGGYFPTSWGLSAALLLWATGLWLVLSGRTDAGRADAVFLVLLGSLTCWIGLSIVWSAVPAQSVLELERALVPLAGVAAVLVLASKEHVSRLTGVLLASITAVSSYALATRLFPDRLGRFDPIATYRLADPLGYWNTLGIFAVLGALLAVGVAADAPSRWARAGAAASFVVLAAALYFTYSRASWIALGLGFAVLFAVTPRRLRTVATALVVAAPAALGVLLASRSDALTHEGALLSSAADEGRRLALVVIVLAAAGAGLVLLLSLAEERVAVSSRARIAIGAALVASVVVAVAVPVAKEGGPVAMTRHAWRAFSGDSPDTGGDLDRRLFSFAGTGRIELWRGALDLYRDHPWTGNGAGTFERYWQSRDDAAFKVRDAHSLYLETLAELGPVGLTLLGAMLLVPIGAGLSVRRRAMLPAALAGYAAFLVHAGVDWDWELSGVTLTALLVGCVLLVAARGGETRTIAGPIRLVACAAVLVASLGAVVVYLGNGALDRAQHAVTAQSYADAVDEANRARRLMPWSPWPLIARGDAQLAVGSSGAAAASYRHAIAIDSGEWRAWFGLGLATKGRVQASALARAHRLYPTNSEIAGTIENATKR